MKILYSDSTMPIGKYKGMKVQDIIEHDAHYIKTFNSVATRTTKKELNVAIADITIQSVRLTF